MSTRTVLSSRTDFHVSPIAARVAVLASGGLDSSVMLAEFAAARRQVFPIYVRAGMIWERAELPMLRRFVKALNSSRVRAPRELRLPMADVAAENWTMTGAGVPGFNASLSSNYIVGRNLSLLAKAAIFCAHMRIGEIAMAPLHDNPFPDARPAFFRAFSRAVELGTGLRLRILTPYLRLSKKQLILRGRDLPLEFTLSCARPVRGKHCGNCTKCAERIHSFRAAGISDPARYARQPPG